MRANLLLRNLLIPLACLLMVVVTPGCRPKQVLTKDEIADANFELFVSQKNSHLEIRQDILDRIPMGIHVLKAGMTREEVFRTLDLPNNLSCASGNGDPRFYRLAFNLQTNRFMVMEFNMTEQPARFNGIELFGEGWGDLHNK